jgi:hypothetical protein
MKELLEFLSKITILRQELNSLNLIKKVGRDRDSKWQENYNKLHQSYKDSLQEIKIGKIRETYLTNHIEIKKAKDVALTNNNSEYIDITFDKYLLDNIDRISFYEKYRQES